MWREGWKEAREKRFPAPNESRRVNWILLPQVISAPGLCPSEPMPLAVWAVQNAIIASITKQTLF